MSPLHLANLPIARIYRQTWTAFGIMIGYVSGLVFFRVPDKPNITGLNWRLMMASVCDPLVYRNNTYPHKNCQF